MVGYTRNDIGVWAEVCARALGCAGGEPGHIQHLREAGVDKASLSVRYGIFGAEPWSETIRAQIEEEMGLDAVDIYGLSEVIGPGVACECREAKQGAHIFEDHFLVEVVDPATGARLDWGETGELVFTTLTKEAFPVLRYRTGDIAAVTREACRCGRTQARMSRVKGRSDDMLIVRGVNVFPSEIERVLLTVTEVAPHYQVMVDRQRALDRLTVAVEVTPEFGALAGDDPGADPLRALRARAEKLLYDTLGIHAEVELRPPRSIPRSEGKAVRIVDRRQAS